jgi:hypothetical protein
MSSNPNHRSAPSNATLLEAARLAFSKGKGLHPADYWFTPGDREEPRLGFKGADIKSSRKRLVRNDEEYTSWIEGMSKSADGCAYLIETANSVYLAPAAPGALKAVPLRPNTRPFQDDDEDDDE